jgi:hypothetical protein
VRYYDISLNLSPETVRWVVALPMEVHERRRMSRGDDAQLLSPRSPAWLLGELDTTVR